MRWLALHLRCRQVPGALAAAAAATAAMWLLQIRADEGPAGPTLVLMTTLLVVVTLTGTLGGPDEALERTASLPWAPRRAVHLLVALAVVVGLLAVTLPTGTGFGPVGLVLRDAAGLLGVTALCASLVGAARAWFVPLAWAIAAAFYPASGPVLGEVLTWPGQPLENAAAAAAAAVLAVAGLIAYALAGPAPRAAAEAAL
jgi:hypothetical protein